MNWEFTGAQTPLDPDEAAGLLIPFIATRGELDEYEQANIQRARLWLAKRAHPPTTLLTDTFVRRLHNEMYRDVWKWAGQFRRTEKNIGVDPIRIATDLRHLLDDARYWLEHGTYAPDELSIRMKHRLVGIHCFANGNGRHSRLLADSLAKALGADPFSWGAGTEAVHARKAYITALRSADNGDIGPLLAFARS